jgi:CheY-like chemotaxis protein
MSAAKMKDLYRLRTPLGHVLGSRRTSVLSRRIGGRMADENITMHDPAEGQGDTVKTILLVDDNHEVAKVLAYALTQEGYQVELATNGLNALDKLRWGLRPWCLLLDMRMPVMTGWDLRSAMSADPQLRDIPVIGMTGGRWKSEDMHGFDALLEKPLHIEQLLDLVKNVAALKIRHLRATRDIPEIR